MEESRDSPPTSPTMGVLLPPNADRPVRAPLAGKVALVTGGAQGIGRAVCQALLEKKVKVCIADVNVTEGAATLKELMKCHGENNVMFAKCDVTSDDDFQTVVKATKANFGHLDILINNAGIGGEEEWDKVVEVNLKGVMRGSMLALRHLMDKDGIRGGTVINTSSILGLKVSPFSPAYCATKHGIIGWTKSWGMQCNVDDTKVKMNAICPKGVDTQLLQNSSKFAINKEKAEKAAKFFRSQSMSPSTAAEAYIKVLEDDVTGAILIVDQQGPYYYVDDKVF